MSESYVSWLRRHVGPAKIFLPSVAAVIVNNHGEILWLHRADFDRWALPGGYLELNETISQAVVREVREETGLQVEPTRLVGIYTSPEFDVTYPNGDQVQNLACGLACRVTGGTLRPDGREARDLGWLPPDTLPPNPAWLKVMVEDWRRDDPEATFRRGAPGQARGGEPFFNRIRRGIGSQKFILPGAAGFIQNKGGEVLLQLRGDNRQWGLPGGSMELGERIDQSVITEVWEETGLHVEPLRVIGVYSDPDFNFTYPHGDQVKVVSTLFECHITGGELAPDGDESLDVRFFPPDALPPMTPHHARRVADGLAQYPHAVF